MFMERTNGHWLGLSLLIALHASLVHAQGQTHVSKSDNLLPIVAQENLLTGSPRGPLGKKGCTSVCFGQTEFGGMGGEGVFYSLSVGPDKVLHNFGGVGDGVYPIGDLAEDANSNFYGATVFGGLLDNGTVFEVDSSGNESVIYDFQGGSDGLLPSAGVIRDASGNLYGTTEGGGGVNGAGTVFELSPTGGGWTERILYSFCSQQPCTDGLDPVGLTMDASGNLYGATLYGGTQGSNNGVIYELSPNGQGGYTQTVLFSFPGGVNGSNPIGGVVLSQGSLFGVTINGGSSHCDFGYGCGVIFQLSPNPPSGWTYNVVHAFTTFDGAFPNAALLADSAGNVYGTATQGGLPAGCLYNLQHSFDAGCGTVFEVSAGGVFSVLYRFAGGLDGSTPEATLAIDASGNLYGTTFDGGGTGCDQENGCGTVFELSPQGGGLWKETILNSFNGTDGAAPTSGIKLPR